MLVTLRTIAPNLSKHCPKLLKLSPHCFRFTKTLSWSRNCMQRNSELAVHGSSATFVNDRYVRISLAKQAKTQAKDIQLSPVNTKKLLHWSEKAFFYKTNKEIALLFRFHATAQIQGRRKRLIVSLLHALPFMLAVRRLHT